MRTYDSNYWAEVTIANHNPLGHLDNGKLSWNLMNGCIRVGMMEREERERGGWGMMEG